MLSMTGYGDCRVQNDHWSVQVEIRSVNSRHLKLVSKISEPYVPLEAELERLIREKLRRGTIHVTLRIEPNRPVDSYRLNLSAIQAYREQFINLCSDWNTRPPADWLSLLSLPGVVLDHVSANSSVHEDWPELSKIVELAIDRLTESRRREGAAMASELLGYSAAIRAQLQLVEARYPLTKSEFADRLRDRVQQLLEKYDVKIEPEQLIREVAIFSERSDIAEEITRLRAHLSQYDEIIMGSSSEGRKLEFLVQEMGREINTLGSKSLDVAISRSGVEMKSTLEKIRELIQNVE